MTQKSRLTWMKALPLGLGSAALALLGMVPQAVCTEENMDIHMEIDIEKEGNPEPPLSEEARQEAELAAARQARARCYENTSVSPLFMDGFLGGLVGVVVSSGIVLLANSSQEQRGNIYRIGVGAGLLGGTGYGAHRFYTAQQRCEELVDPPGAASSAVGLPIDAADGRTMPESGWASPIGTQLNIPVVSLQF